MFDLALLGEWRKLFWLLVTDYSQRTSWATARQWNGADPHILRYVAQVNKTRIWALKRGTIIAKIDREGKGRGLSISESWMVYFEFVGWQLTKP